MTTMMDFTTRQARAIALKRFAINTNDAAKYIQPQLDNVLPTDSWDTCVEVLRTLVIPPEKTISLSAASFFPIHYATYRLSNKK